MDPGTWEPSDFPNYRLKMFLNLGIATAANALGFCLIVWASPKDMRTYRWFLLNILFSGFCLDLYVMAITQPFPLFPILGYCTLGIMGNLGQFVGGYVAVLIFIMLVGFYVASVLSAAAYRFAAVYNCHTLLITKLGISVLVCIHLFVTLPLQIAAASVIVELYDHVEEELKANISHIYPNIGNIFNSNVVCSVITMESPALHNLFYTALATVFIVTLVAVPMIISGFVSLYKRKAKYSERLYKMHMQLSLSLLVQILMPAFQILIPAISLLAGIFLHIDFFYDIIRACFLYFSMHSTLSAFAMIMFTGPYRNAIKKCLLKLKIIQIIAAKLLRGNSPNQIEPTKTRHPKLQQQPDEIQMAIVKKSPIAIHTTMPMPTMMVKGAALANPVEAIAAVAADEARKKVVPSAADRNF